MAAPSFAFAAGRRTASLAQQHLVVPLNRLSIHEVTLPPTPKHRLRAALAGFLEEELLDDPADLHFALAPDAHLAMQGNRPFKVMVCSKKWLKDCVEKAQAQGRVFDVIWPESKALQETGWNLAQFEFAPKARVLTWGYAAAQSLWHSPQWLWARRGLLLLVLVQLVGINLWAWRDTQDLAKQRKQIGQLLTQTFPDVRAVVDPVQQMTKALAQYKAAHGALDPQGLEAQLAAKASSGGAYSQIEYANNELKLTPLKAPSP